MNGRYRIREEQVKGGSIFRILDHESKQVVVNIYGKSLGRSFAEDVIELLEERGNASRE